LAYVLSWLIWIPRVYITWFFNHARYSLLLPVAFHLSFNVLNVVWLPVTSNIAAFGLLIAAEWVIAVLIARHLEPEPLGAKGLGAE
jgi:hypothetical protein